MKHDLIFVPKIHLIISALNLNLFLTFLSSIDKFDLITIFMWMTIYRSTNSPTLTKMGGGVGYFSSN